MTPRREEPVTEEEGGEVRGGGPQVKEGGDNSVFDGGGTSVLCTANSGSVVVDQTHPSVVQRHSPLGIRQGPSPIQQQRANVVVTSPGVMIPPPAFWVSPSSPTCRINGVRPELIGGGSVNFSPQQQASAMSLLQHHEMKPPVTHAQSSSRAGVLRAAPTVIMGEAGGVRTMIWSQPTNLDSHHHNQQPPQQQQQHHHQHMGTPSTSASCWSSSPSSASSGNGSGSNEEAAQILLNLGQEQQQQQQQQHHLQATATTSSRPAQFPPPLNMERLWAGDLTQLPVCQQQALNLTSAAATTSGVPIPWTQRNGGNGPPGMTLPEHHPMTHPQEDQEEDEQPMICMICEDKATGLHYGIITCEG